MKTLKIILMNIAVVIFASCEKNDSPQNHAKEFPVKITTTYFKL